MKKLLAVIFALLHLFWPLDIANHAAKSTQISRVKTAVKKIETKKQQSLKL